MSDQYICISCWQEFTVAPEEIATRGGRVVCPRCGYVQPFQPEAGSGTGEPPAKLEDPGQDLSSVAQEIPWSSVEGADKTPAPETEGGEPEFPVGEEERTDRVSLTAEELTGAGLQKLAEMIEDDGEDTGPLPRDELPPEPAPEPLPAPAAAPKEATEDTADDAVLVSEKGPSAIEWQLKTPSGLTFKFTDPEALLGWKKKISTYKQLDVSPDGQRWVDFARFVRQYEELGDPLKAFILSETLGDAELPPPSPPAEAPTPPPQADGSTREPLVSMPSADAKAAMATQQFTFKVKDEKGSGWGRYFLLALVGLVIGAGIVLYVLHLTGNLP